MVGVPPPSPVTAAATDANDTSSRRAGAVIEKFSSTAAAGKVGWMWRVRTLRMLVLVIFILHIGLCALSIVMAVASSSSMCPSSLMVGALLIAVGSCARVIWVIGTALSQAATAVTMIAEQHVPASQIPVTNSVTRSERRMWYKRWLWWGRLGAIVTFFQLAGAVFVSLLGVRNAHSSFCFSGSHTDTMLENILFIVLIGAWVLSCAQCCVGSDVLSWRSLYEMQNEAWRAHYREMFDHGIRELLCCLGRSRYLSAMDEDEVDSVAALLGDLVAYRAAGASHLEFLAGVALLRTPRQKDPVAADFPPAPDSLVKEAALLHPYAVAAYTGPLLDIGRNPLFFLCAWMYRQGILTLWNRRRRPQLDGDNWWRGHAAAFLRASHLSADALLKGRVHQRNRETVYFVVELKHMKTLLVAIRGTETPEDLLTDGLGRECVLTDSDIHGLMNTFNLSETSKQVLCSSKPHYGHAGVVAAARELAFELDNPEDNPLLCDDEDGPASSKPRVGFLSTVLGPGGRCEGYSLRFVGHSLGGSIAAVTGMMLCDRYPALHVYGYGVLPCVDAVVAEACYFMTSIVYNDEFSSRLSVASLMRLRAASLRALAADSDTDSAAIARLARRLFGWKQTKDSKNNSINNNNNNDVNNIADKESCSSSSTQHHHHHHHQQQNHQQHHHHNQYTRRRFEHKMKGGVFVCYHACHCLMCMAMESENVQSEYEVDGHDEHVHDDVGGDKHGGWDGDGKGGVVKEDGDGNGDGDGDGDGDGHDDDEVGVVAGRMQQEAVGLMGDEYEGIPGEDDDNELVGFKPGADLDQYWPVELLMPGLVVHLIRTHGHSHTHTHTHTHHSHSNGNSNSNDSSGSGSDRLMCWSRRRRRRREEKRSNKQHKAIIRDRNSFRDIIVSPSMFLDHMPWRCQRGLCDVVQQWAMAMGDDDVDIVQV